MERPFGSLRDSNSGPSVVQEVVNRCTTLARWLVEEDKRNLYSARVGGLLELISAEITLSYCYANVQPDYILISIY